MASGIGVDGQVYPLFHLCKRTIDPSEVIELTSWDRPACYSDLSHHAAQHSFLHCMKSHRERIYVATSSEFHV